MTKVTRPLFSDSATGTYGGLGSYRMGRNGPEFMDAKGGTRNQTDKQLRLMACFAMAKAAHKLTPKHQDKRHGHLIWVYDTPWADFWRQWLVDHPECNE